MLRAFQYYGKILSSEKVFKKVLDLRKTGHNDEALRLCTKLVEENPKEVFYRHQLVVLQQEMGLPIKVPSISGPKQNTL